MTLLSHVLIGDRIIYLDRETLDLASKVQDCYLAKRKTIATAESCTGGLLASALTELSGSSGVYCGGVSAYSNEVKANVLGVPEELLTKYGAVSEQVAISMAYQCRVLCSADVGISLTGVAGPTGGSDAKPVGTVWLGASYEGHEYATNLKLSGSRAEIRNRAVHQALILLCDIVNATTAANGD